MAGSGSTESMVRIKHSGLVFYQFTALRQERGLQHGFFARLGGVSRPPFATLNVGASVGDDPQAVAMNRQRCFSALGLAEPMVVTPYQVHGTRIARVGPAEGGRVIADTDGLLSDREGTVLFLRFADCVPILLYDRRCRAIGLVHAGWRGTLDGIAALAVAAMRDCFGTDPAALWAGIGPAIGPCHYEVPPDLAEYFARRFGPQVLAWPGDGGTRLDLPAANALALQEAGVRSVVQAGLCTACHTDEFFSHRAEGGHTGRLAALAGLVVGDDR